MDPILGQIMMFAGNFAPRGWALCDGQLLPIASYSALFSILGTTYGGDGRTTFALPNLQSRVPMHPGRGPGLSQRSLGQTGGSETNTLNITQMPPHSHTASVPAKEEANTEIPNGHVIAGAGFNGFGTEADTGINMAQFTTANTGGGQSINNVQPFQCVNFIIALQGIFPSRN